MAQLNSIIGSILRDMVLAQHQANLYAASLSEIYSKDGSLELFPMPGIAIGELELDLHYAVTGNSTNDDGSEESQYEVNYPALSKKLKQISESYSAILLSAATGTLKKLFPVESTTGDNPLAKFESTVTLKNQFESFLSRKILEALRSRFTLLIGEQGNLNKQIIKETVIKVGESELTHHEDLNELLEKQAEGKTKLSQALTAAVESSIDTILQDASIMRKRLMPSAEIIVSGEALAQLPSDSIQRIRLKLSPRDIQLYDEPKD